MIESLWKRIAAIANLWTFLILVLLFLGFRFFFFNPLGEHYPKDGSLDVQTGGFSPSDVPRILGDFKTRGLLHNYLIQDHGDLIFALVYASMLAVAIVGLGKSIGSTKHWLVLLPFFAAIGDYTENLTIIPMIRTVDAAGRFSPTLAMIGSVGSRIKWAFMAVSVVVVIVFAVQWVRDRYFAKAS